MDLWQAIARLRERPLALVAVVVAAAALGVFGWVSTKPSYTVSTSQSLQSARPAGGDGSIGSYESGVIATMVAQNAATEVAGRVQGGTLTATNTIVNPPLALPLISMTATAESSEQALSILQTARTANVAFLDTVTGNRTAAGELKLVETVENPQPVMSQQPRVRSAGAGVLLGLLGGILVLIVVDVLLRRGHEPSTSGRSRLDDASATS